MCHDAFWTDQIPLDRLLIKTMLWLVLTYTKCISGSCALSVHPSCLVINGDSSRATLKPNPAFAPKSIRGSFSFSTITLKAFHPPPHVDEEEKSLHNLCLVRALMHYVKHTVAIRTSQQLFVCYGAASHGWLLSKQRLSYWFFEGISLAYTSEGRAPPAGIGAHSTGGVAASSALFGGVSVEDICTEASWPSPCPFISFSNLYLIKVAIIFNDIKITQY